MRYELFIANRYLRSKRRTGFISIITYISAAGVMVGVAALVIVLSVANGFESEVRDRIIGANAHIRLTLFHEMPMKDYKHALQEVTSLSHVVGGSPFIMGKGMLRYGKSIEGALIQGIDEHTIGQVGDLPQTMVAGKLQLDSVNFPASETPDYVTRIRENQNDGKFPASEKPGYVTLPGIILGRQLSFRLGATIGDSLIAISPTGMTSLLSSPQLKRFVVVGIFETGIFEFDDTYSYISIKSAQDLFQLKDAVTGIEFKLDNLDNADIVKIAIQDKLGYPYYVRTWYDMHSVLFRWMKLEKWLFTILLSLIIMVAAFNIVSSQIMMVMEKQREIGILKAIGATREEIMRIFLYIGLLIGIVGTTFGLLLGWAVCYGQQTFKWFSLPGDVYFLSTLPVRMQPLDFVIITLVSLTLTILATVYPARRAGGLDPVEAIRYE